MILREALAGARERLRASGSEEAEIEAEVLLRHALGIDRAVFLRLLNEPISQPELSVYERALSRRFAGEPTAYITGVREFCGLDFKVTPATLIPRPETELLVEVAIEAVRARQIPATVVDAGTGSGAIAVSLAKVLPDVSIYATDASSEALDIARENARRHGVQDRIVLRRGDLLEPLRTRVDVIVANLPYVTVADWQQLPREIRDHEPRRALEAGLDGLDVIRALLRQAPAYLNPEGFLCLEFGIGQREALVAAASASFPAATIEAREDFGGLPRAMIVRLPEQSKASLLANRSGD